MNARPDSRPGLRLAVVAAGLAAAALAGCAQMPTGPSVAVMPGPNKPFEVFVSDDKTCREWALSSSGSENPEAANQRAAGATAAGVVIGAAAGALLGGNHNGAAVGAAFGGLTGASVGADQGQRTAGSAQRRYDIAYQQCMYAKGNQVPGHRYAAGYRSAPAPVPPLAPQPPAGIQPPPVTQ
jgi:uncharacterized protein YcfJ